MERFHRTLKAALRARLNSPAWMDELPVVLLGIRTAWREDADTTPAQMVYGTALRLPGEMIPHVPPLPEPSSDFLRALQSSMRAPILPQVPALHHDPRTSYVPAALDTAAAVYVRHDTHKLPLQRPYNGPFQVLQRGPKIFIINYNGARQTVSIDRLKPASGALPHPATFHKPPVKHQDQGVTPTLACLLRDPSQKWIPSQKHRSARPLPRVTEEDHAHQNASSKAGISSKKKKEILLLLFSRSFSCCDLNKHHLIYYHIATCLAFVVVIVRSS